MDNELFDRFRAITETGWWKYELFNNIVGDYVIAFGVFILLLIVFKIFQLIILNRLHFLAKKTKTDIDDTLIKIVRSLRPPFYSFLALYGAVRFLTLTDLVEKAFNYLILIWVVYQVIIAAQILIEYIFEKIVAKNDDPGTRGALTLLKNIAKVILWIAGVLMILSNLGINVTALVAGLGIGGVAVAFAFQNILEDLFSSFAIVFDKPFQIGDFIIVGDKMGVVEKIGIKTTRLRALDGEELVMSNKQLTGAEVQNYKKMEERRISFTVGATYETQTEKLQRIPGMIKNIVESVEQARFDRAHFKSFDDSALIFEVVYYVETGDYNIYMDVQENINFKVREAFENEGIEMAYPTQTVYLQKEQ